MSAGIAMLDILAGDPPYPELERKGALFEEHMTAEIAAGNASGAVHWNRIGSMGTLFFAGGPVRNFAQARRSDTAAYGRYFHAALDRGVFLAPAQYVAMFLSSAHTDADLRKTAPLP